jgi:hypothetical protein
MVTLMRLTLVGIVLTLLTVIFRNNIEAGLFEAGFDNAKLITDWVVQGATVLGGVLSVFAILWCLKALEEIR